MDDHAPDLSDSIFDAASVGIVALGPDGKIARINPALAAMFGYAPAELLGRPLEVLLPEELRAAHRGHRRAYLAAPHPRPMGAGLDLLGRRKGGEVFPIEASLSTLRVGGELVSVAFVADVSERKRLERQRDRLLEQERSLRAAAEEAARRADEARALLDGLVQSAPIGVAFLDRELRYQLVNAHLAEMNGPTPEEHLGRTPGEVMPALAPRLEALLRRVVEHGESYINLEGSGETPAAPGVERSWLASYFPVREGGVTIGVGASVLEVTDRRQAEEERRRQAALTRLLQVVAVAANEATAPRAALQTAVEQICATLGWPVGHVYLAVDGPSAPLGAGHLWHLDDPERYGAFRAASEATPLGPEDLPGLVLISGQPEWVADLTSLPAARLAVAGALGLRAAFAFPVLVGAEVVALLEFFAPAPQPPDASLLATMGHVGAQLGRVVERARAEAALRASEGLYRTLAGNLPNGSVLLFDHSLRYSIADGQALQRAGLARAMVEGRTLYEVLSPERAAALEPFYRAALAGDELVHELSSGGRTYQVHFLPVRDEAGAIVAGMAMSWDITPLKQAEQALIEERARLARRIEERTADLRAANAELAKASRLKDEFLASMSHELRTPLNAILGLSEALREQVYGPVGDRQGRAVAMIEESGRHLLELINDILDLAKIGAGKLTLEIEEVALAQICEASLRMVREAAQKKELALRLELDPRARIATADPRRLKQILVNLLDNAVKFTPVGGSVGLSVSADPAHGLLAFTVWDSGIGIEPEQLERLFQPFVQLDSRLARRYPGTGLGLALVYSMCELHGGGVSVSSAPGAGSRFVVTLPWGTPQAGRGAADDPEAPATARTIRRALLVEDSPAAASQLLRYLRELGVSTTTVTEGRAALASAAEARPDLIVLDILLPDSSGWEVLARLKADPRTAAIPVVIISVVDDEARGLALGAAAYVVKPFGRQELAAALRRLARGPAGPARPIGAGAGGLILLAEDNEANIQTTVDFLTTVGYSTSVARDGAEAVASAIALRPDLILMDIQMPGMDGLEATRRLRADPSLARTPIIALTALAMPGDRERCLAAGADDYLSKPVSFRRLAAVIAEHLARTRQP